MQEPIVSTNAPTNRFMDAVVTVVVGAMSSFWLDGSLASATPADQIA